ncbi:DUF4176 domain-containing protein [uncultured Leifsonia sp.]|uniref:DUF4176 domain-containing protein n=1 Tax=uncultured Leifsonia sp. TaxID=340359 RepID=UPI0025FB0F80|nr:DUF4176 domain-containing protein [uncultured Leifsonia sp.]
MTLELAGTLLGLGSVVRLDSEQHSGLFVVLARGAFRPDNESSEVVPRYLVGPHPYGEAPDQETFPILAGEVHEVVHEGYTDDADDTFLTELLDQMENGRRSPTCAQQFTGSLTAIPEGHAVAAESNPAQVGGDPFAELRRIVDQDYQRSES